MLPTLTVIIPAFNEQANIAATLDRLLAQREEILQIVVVNNNSTDDTADIVREYARRDNAIELVSEARRGVAFARNAGYDASRGEITARLDADTIPAPGWASAIRNYFADAAPEVALATGPLTPFDSPFRRVFERSNERLIQRAKAHSSEHLGAAGLQMAPGGNCAMRTALWPSIRAALSERTDIYEDLDLSLCCTQAGLRIAFIYEMAAASSARRFRSNPVAYRRYLKQLPATYREHGMTAKARTSHLDVLNNQVVHLITWLPTRAYDTDTGRLSWRRLFRHSPDNAARH